MKLIIAGSRSLKDSKLIDKAIAYAGIKTEDIDEVISGEAPGIDTLGKNWAKARGIHVEPFPADWENLKVKPCIVGENQYGKYNKLAGFNRNQKMAEYADKLLAITNGSSGTADMIERMEKLGKQYWVYEI